MTALSRNQPASFWMTWSSANSLLTGTSVASYTIMKFGKSNFISLSQFFSHQTQRKKPCWMSQGIWSTLKCKHNYRCKSKIIYKVLCKYLIKTMHFTWKTIKVKYDVNAHFQEDCLWVALGMVVFVKEASPFQWRFIGMIDGPVKISLPFWMQTGGVLW